MTPDASIRRLRPAGGTGPRSRRARTPAARVLLVDDRPDNLLALEAVLEPLGFELLTASGGAEALRRLLEEEVAAIVLDVQMPGIDGFETAELLRSRSATRAIPVLFLTAAGDCLEHQLRGYELGAFGYVAKPFEPELLRSRVRSMVGWSGELRRLAGANAVRAEPGAALDALGLAPAPAPAPAPAAGRLVRCRRLLEATFDATFDAPARARAAVTAAAGEHLGPRLDVVLLLVSELVANAVLHARSTATVRLDHGEEVLRIEVDDAGSRMPHLVSPGAGDEHGRGLQMVRRLADRYGWTELVEGKGVWFEIDLEGARANR